MWKRLKPYAPALIMAVLLLAGSAARLMGQAQSGLIGTVLNGFMQPDANGNNVLNINGNGGLAFDGKLTDIDHGAASLNASGYASVTTNLTSIVDCTFSLKSATVPTITTITGIFTTGSAVVEILAWKPTAAGTTTLIPASATSTVSYVCFGT